MPTYYHNVNTFYGESAPAEPQKHASVGAFLAMFLLVFLSTTYMAYEVDFIPEHGNAIADAAVQLPAAPVVAVTSPELPTRIEVPRVGINVSVSNPESKDANVLDNALLKGTVRYPTSAELGEDGNVLIFGHSSYLPIVNNKNFKAFDGIQNLKAGDRIIVTGTGHSYVYAVKTVSKASAASSDSIPLSVSGRMLTLATCNSFGEKTDRFIVTAELVETDLL